MIMNPPPSISAKAIKTDITGLSIGMYVSHLDRDWVETPFIYQGFMIETVDDINILEEYCEYVWVEPFQGSRDSLHRLEVLKPFSSPSSYTNHLSISQEYRKSYDVFKASRKVTKNLLDEVRLSGSVDIKQAKKTVETCLDSILRNESAMLWMSKIRDNDEYTAEHCLNVCILAITFGRQLGLERDELSSLGLCGLLHDVGKMRVPPEILNKAGKLSEKEWRVMQGHTHFGRNLLMKSKDLGQTLDVAYSHHERIDGNGYPQGVKGNKISRYSKIIAIVDAFDAMTAERCYSAPLTPTAAVKNIYNDRGAHFDEHLALQFIKTIGLYPPGSIVELQNGYLAIVIERHHRYRHLPKVLLVSEQGKALAKKRLIDLSLIEQEKLSRKFLIKLDHPDGYLGITIKDYQEFLLLTE